MEKFKFGTPEYKKENVEDKEKEKQFFEGVKTYLQDLYGIEFNTIELIGLKKICVQVWKDFWEYRHTPNEIIPYAEAEGRFLHEFFDMTELNRMQMFKNENERKAYFKKIHEEKNLI